MIRIPIIILIFIFLNFIPSISIASDLSFLDDYFIKEDMKIKDDVFITGNNVTNKGMIVGDMTVMALNISNEGEIKGDILSGSISEQINGIVKGNLRAFAEQIAIFGDIEKNVTAFTKELTLEKEGVVDGSITVFAEKLEINGLVGKDIRGIIDTLVVNGIVKGDMDISVKSIIFGPNAKIVGNLSYRSKDKLDIPYESISGEVRFTESRPFVDRERIDRIIKLIKLIKNIIIMSGLFITGLILVGIFPEQIDKIAQHSYKKELRALGRGILLLIGIPLISTILIITIIGIPTAVITLLVFSILVYLSKIPVAICIGKYILKSSSSLVLQMLLGLTIVTLFSYIPYLGVLTDFVILAVGFGAYYFYIKEYFNSNA